MQEIAVQTPVEAADGTLPVWPVFGVEADVRPALAEAVAGGRATVLGLMHTHEGRPPPLGEGAQILFDGGAAAGFLSGGCVEGDIALHARAVLEDGAAASARLWPGRDPPDIQLLCGSRIEVLLERIGPSDEAARRLLALAAQRQPALWLSDGRVRACLAPGEAGERLPWDLGSALDAAIARPAASGSAGLGVFRRHAPRSRLVVVGGDPITLAIARLACEAGFETALVRPKGPAAPPPLPQVRYFRGEPGEAFDALGLDPWTAVAVATHDIDIDHQALCAVLPSNAGYVGALGSRRRLPERLARLRASGVADANVAKLRAPIGLNIGARSPWEVAVSVIAEVIQALKARESTEVWRGPSGPR